jgi:hypothetical protein
MALNLYRRHLRIARKCAVGHEPDSRSYEPDELRRGWKKCYCPIYACGTLAGTFKRKNTERFKWDKAKSVAAAWEATGRWDGKFKLPPSVVAAAPTATAPGRMAIADACTVFMALREGETIAAATLRKYRTFAKQILAFAESRGYITLDQVSSNSTTATISLPSGSQAHSIAVNAAGNLAAIGLSAKAAVALIDPSQNKVISVIGAGGTVSVIDTAVGIVRRR